MEGVLEGLQKGLERLNASRESEKQAAKERGEELPRDTVFGTTLTRLKVSMGALRRCYWKSGSEMLFPIMYGTMSYASHRCWQVYIKPMVWMCCEH